MQEIARYDTYAIRPEVARKIATLVSSVWPQIGANIDVLAKRYRTPDPDRPDARSFVLWDGTDAVAHARTFSRVIRHRNGEMKVLALGAVCVHPTRRGEGFGKRIAAEAFKLIGTGRYEVALFQTELTGFYERFGAVEVRNKFVNRQSNPSGASPWWNPRVMIHPNLDAWPEGEIDLNGPGF